MAIRIKQGDAYSVPVLIRLNGEPWISTRWPRWSFTFGDGMRTRDLV